MPCIQEPTPGSPDALTELLELNKEVTLTDDQKNLFDAYSLVLYTFRQNQLRIDREADSPNLLLHNKVTDRQN